jgi:hypothetical protein
MHLSMHTALRSASTPTVREAGRVSIRLWMVAVCISSTSPLNVSSYAELPPFP